MQRPYTGAKRSLVLLVVSVPPVDGFFRLFDDLAFVVPSEVAAVPAGGVS